MLKSALIHIVPFALALLWAGGLRVFGGPERAARGAGIGVMLAFAVSWVIFVKPGWAPVTDLTRIGHIALGAAVAGLALDLLAPRRFWAAAVAAIFLLGSAWSSVTGKLELPTAPNLDLLAPAAILAVLAFLGIARLDVLRTQGLTATILLAVSASGIAVMAAVAGDPKLAASGAILALAVLGYVVAQALFKVPVGDSIILGAGSALLAMAWTLGHMHPASRLALLLVPLIFFAEGTAKRVPLPQARISAVLYPLILVVLAALPVALAVLVVYVTVRS